jgi:hypothetical protein
MEKEQWIFLVTCIYYKYYRLLTILLKCVKMLKH